MDTFEDWYTTGVEAGYCGAIGCVIHDGVPMTATEEEDDEPCIPMVRLYEDTATRKAVEANHSPSQWRKTNEGFKL
jgi:hypothetical protein